MSVSLVATVQANQGQTANSATAAFTLPSSGLQTGDTAVFVTAQNSGTATYTPPSGWTTVVSANNNNNVLMTTVIGKDLALSDAGTTVTLTSSASTRLPGLMFIFRGTSLSAISTPAPTTSAAGGSSMTSPTVTTTVASSWIANFWCGRFATASSSGAITVPGTHTADASVNSAFSTSPNYTIEASHLTTPGAAGSYGGDTATSSPNWSHYTVFTLIVPPSAPAYSGTWNPSGSGSATFAQSSMTAAAPWNPSGNGAANLAGSPAIPGSLGLSGVDSLSLAGSPAIAGALACSGSTSLSMVQPTGGTIAFTGFGSLALSGQGALWVYSGPVTYEYAPFQPFTARWSRLVFEIAYGQTVWRNADGSWQQQYAPDPSLLDGALDVFEGGRNYFLTDQQLADLIAGGWGSYISLEAMP